MFNSLLQKMSQNPHLEDFLKPTALKQFGRYLIIGFTTFGLEYSMFRVMLDIVKVNYLISNISVFTVVFWFNYLFNRIWSFKSTEPLSKQVPKYALLFLFNLVVANIALMYVLTDMLLIDPRISKVLIMFAIVSWNFILYKKVIYK